MSLRNNLEVGDVCGNNLIEFQRAHCDFHLAIRKQKEAALCLCPAADKGSEPNRDKPNRESQNH